MAGDLKYCVFNKYGPTLASFPIENISRQQDSNSNRATSTSVVTHFGDFRVATRSAKCLTSGGVTKLGNPQSQPLL